MTYLSRANQSGYTYRPDCGRWACPDCRPKLEADWNEHASNMFATCPAGVGYLCVPEDLVRAALKRLSRAGTQYIKVRGHGIFHIYAASTDFGRKALSQQQAADLFEEHVALAPSGQGHVISSSRAWRRSRPDQESSSQDPDDLRCIAVGPGPEAVRQILTKLGQPCSLTEQTLSFRLESQETIQPFVIAVLAERKACPNLPSYTKKRKEISDKRPAASTGSRRLTPNQAFEALRSP